MIPFQRALQVATVLAITTACSAEQVGEPTGGLPDIPWAVRTALVPLDVFGVSEALPGSGGCTATGHRQFDFWVGSWNVYGGPTTNIVGTSRVDSELDGCAVVENWTSAFQATGRSLNAYDAATGTWSQMWVGSGGCPFSVILMEGGFMNGSMTLTGRREQPVGFLIAPPCGPQPPVIAYSHTDQFRWTLLESGDVLQQIAAANNDAPLPPLPAPETVNGLRYESVETPTPLSPGMGSYCPFRAAAKQFDFMLGSWEVHQGKGEGSQGTATFRKDQADCLVEERFEGPDGYEGLSFNTFDVYTQQWVRTYVDNWGRRLLMKGGMVDGAMRLQGTMVGTDGPVEIRITWTPVAADSVVQRWEYSRDGGTRWQASREITYTRP